MSRSTEGTARRGFRVGGTRQSCPRPAASATDAARRDEACPLARGMMEEKPMRALVCDLSVPRQVVSALLGRVDKRFFFGPFSPAALKEIPEPALPADDWVVLATRLCGIC